MWRKEYRIVYYSWEFDTLQSFYRDLLRLPQMYGWYTSPVDRGCKFKIGDNRLELICRHPTLPQGPAGMRLEAKDIELCYANLKKEPRVRYPPPAVSSVGRIQLLHQGPRGQLGGGLPALRAVSAHGGR